MEISIRHLDHTYPGQPPKAALQDICLEIPSGQFVALIGPSGCGKSTLLRLIADLLHPTSGAILIDGRSPQAVKAARETAWMAQSPALLPWLTGRQNVELAAHFSNPTRKNAASPHSALTRVGLADLNGEYPVQLSGGMQQRLALARLLVQNAQLWLMDEPFAALDEITRESLAGELIDIWTPQRPTVVWVTHNIYEAVRMADRIVVFSAGPGKITADIPIPLERPRREDSPTFQHILQQARTALQQAAHNVATGGPHA